MKQTAIHKPFLTKKTILPVLNTALAVGGKLWTTDLDVWVYTDTDLKDGVYQLVGNAFVPSPMGVDEWPSVPEITGSTVILEMDRIAVTRLLAMQSTDQIRYILNAVLLRVADDTITGVSTDGRRLTKSTWHTHVPKKAHGDYIVGGGKHNPFALLLKDKKRDKLTLTFPKTKKGEYPQYISISNGEQTIIAKCVDGTYPNFTQVIPAEDDGLFYVDTQVMKAALRELAPFMPVKTRRYQSVSTCIPIKFEEDCIRMKAKDNDREISHEVTVPAKFERTNDTKQLNVSIDFLFDSFIQEDGITYVGYTDELSPFTIGTKLEKPHNKEQVARTDIVVQMPIRVS